MLCIFASIRHRLRTLIISHHCVINSINFKSLYSSSFIKRGLYPPPRNNLPEKVYLESKEKYDFFISDQQGRTHEEVYSVSRSRAGSGKRDLIGVDRVSVIHRRPWHSIRDPKADKNRSGILRKKYQLNLFCKQKASAFSSPLKRWVCRMLLMVSVVCFSYKMVVMVFFVPVVDSWRELNAINYSYSRWKQSKKVTGRETCCLRYQHKALIEVFHIRVS